MDLFVIQGNNLYPSTYALMIEPFASMWENDNDPAKHNVLRDFKFIELLCSPKKSNPFFGYSKDIRPAKVKKEVYKDEHYEISSDVIAATAKYLELLKDSSPSYDMFDAAMSAADKLKVFLRGFNLSERTQSGGLLLKPADITRALKEIPDAAKGIEVARNKVQQELEEDAKTRNQREIGQYEE